MLQIVASLSDDSIVVNYAPCVINYVPCVINYAPK
jgi:hypothetical protein